MNVRRSSILPVVLLIITSPVSGQVSYRVAARSGQAAPNTNGAILGTGFGGPFIDENGRVGFTNRLVIGVGDATISNYDCIYSDVGGSLHIVARLGDPTPGNINYHWGTNSFTTLAMSPTGQIVFHGVAIGNAFGGDGIWAQNAAGGVNYIAISGEDVPGLPGVKYQTPDYGYKCMSATADVPFSSILQQGVGGVTDFNNEILMVSTGSGPYRIVAREGDLLPSPLGGTVQVGSTWGGAVHVFSARILMNDGAITFYASTSGAPLGGSSAAIFSETRTMAALRVVVGDNEDAPGLGPNVKFGPYLDFSVNAGGNVAFVADLQGSGVTPGLNTNSEWMEAGGALVLVARQGDAAPGGGVYETVIYPPVISADGWITFPAWLRQGVGGITTANDVGIFLGQSEGNAIKVMGEGQDAPGLPAGYKFGNELVSPSINNSHRVAFNASISGGAPFSENQNDSIWATDENGALVLVVAKGQSFQVGPGDNRIITGCGDVVRGTAAQDGLGYQFNNANQLAFTLTFSGGTTAVVVATIGGAPCIAPNITAHPAASQSVCNGGSVQLSVTAGGTPTPTFQWRRGVTNISNDAHITGATTSTLTIN
ncbi:MAG TPA: immunoglobulin domain-containing protein, partial [Phycisphaerae bacterium]|nr:immunoglobulin domain-containing protein [Phycisphaerae bacterium]